MPSTEEPEQLLKDFYLAFENWTFTSRMNLRKLYFSGQTKSLGQDFLVH